MKQLALLTMVLLSLRAGVGDSANGVWSDLKGKRDKLSNIHQEFQVTRTTKTPHGTQSSKWEVVLDMDKQRWREKSVSGSGNHLKIFDGGDLFSMEEGGDEFIRVSRHSKDVDPVPSPYLSEDADWSKSREVQRKPCGLPDKDHTCVVLDVRIKPWTKNIPPNKILKMVDGSARIMVDTETGLVLALRTVEAVQTDKIGYQSEVNFRLKRFSYGTPREGSLFERPPADFREVKELSPWNASKIKKQLNGKAAPELAATDINGKPIVLSAFKGKTVLLDFWTTWCPPCRADAPVLDKLYSKYGGQDLMIVGVSVSEDRPIVEDFLKAHPHEFPIVLTSENEMPSAYRIGVFPTYIVIDRDGTVTSAVEGDKGFSELRKLLKKAGLETE